MSSPSSAPALAVRGWASEKLFLGMSFWEYVKRLATPGNFLAGLIMAIGLPLMAYRFIFGLGASTTSVTDQPLGALDRLRPAERRRPGRGRLHAGHVRLHLRPREVPHAEVVRIEFDPRRISYRELLEIFYSIHDPTTPNRQGNDVGTQYRSAIYLHSAEQRSVAEGVIREAQPHYRDPIVTELAEAGPYWRAEEHHQEYFRHNPGQGYCLFVVAPKVNKFRQTFAAKRRKSAGD